MPTNLNDTEIQELYKNFNYNLATNPLINQTKNERKLLDTDGSNLAQLQEDKIELSKSSTDDKYSADDGKISPKDKLINFAKGLISPVTNMFKSPKNFLIGAASIAGVSALTVATGGAIAPLLVTLGVAGGTIQLGKSAYNAATATTDEAAKNAWQGLGAGTTAVVGSVAGAKAAAKGANIEGAESMNAFQATLACIKNTPKAISNSFKSFTSGEFLVNLKLKEKLTTTNDENTTKKTDNANNTTKNEEVKPENKEVKTEAEQAKNSSEQPVENNDNNQAIKKDEPQVQEKTPIKNVETSEEASIKEEVVETKTSKEQPHTQDKQIATTDETVSKTDEVIPEQNAKQEIQQETPAKIEENTPSQTSKQESVVEVKVQETSSGNMQLDSSLNTKFKNGKIYIKKDDGSWIIDEVATKKYFAMSVKDKEAYLFKLEQRQTEAFVNEHFNDIENIIRQENGGKIGCYSHETKETIGLEDIITPYDKELGKLYHYTTPEAKNSILQEGFRTDIAPQHGNLDGVGGTYFTTTENPGAYGGAVIEAKFNGKIASINTDALNNIKVNLSNQLAVEDYAKSIGLTDFTGKGESIMRLFLLKKIQEMGYQGIIGDNYSYAANCRYFSALNPKNIEIIK